MIILAESLRDFLAGRVGGGLGNFIFGDFGNFIFGNFGGAREVGEGKTTTSSECQPRMMNTARYWHANTERG